jgi:hypothetical protein
VNEIPEPENYDVKEVYSFYGLAAYCGQVLEKGLVNLVVALHTEGVTITREQFDSIFATYDSRTLGQLLRNAHTRVAISSEIDQLLSDALSKRNWLVHNYFAERAAAFMTDEGCKDMIEELRELIALFQRADDEIKPIYRSLLERRGVTDEYLEQEGKAMIARFLESRA